VKLKLVLVSDTHGLHRDIQIPDGDILIHAGDLFLFGKEAILDDFNDFLGTLPHRHKIVVAGNHDSCFQKAPAASRARLTQAIYLQDEAATLEGIKFYGSPWQPWFGNMAFNLPRGAALRQKWELIPPDVAVLITHSPPFGYRDGTSHGEHVGCHDLAAAVRQRQPQLHVFGHVHEAAGVTREGPTTFVNASICDLSYRPIHPPVVFEYELPVSPDRV
jgi:Icc-related predicted phosphoesterase